jgi:hypothetical protein
MGFGTEDEDIREIMICYNDMVYFDLEDLGDEAWQTGCPLCGGNCWDGLSQEEMEDIEKSLDLED